MHLDRIGLVMASELNADGWMGIQPAPLGGPSGAAEFLETLHPAGFLSRPVDPETDADGNPTTGTSVLLLNDGDEGFALPLSDPRYMATVVQLEKGDTLVYATDGTAFTRWKAAGEVVTLTTTDNTPKGRTIYHSQGPDGFEWSCPWGRMSLGPYGFHVVHSSGARLDLMAISAPGLPSSLGSLATLSAATVQINGAAVSIGTELAPAANEVVKTSIIGAVDALVLAIGKITTVTPGATALADPAVVTALATFHTAMQDFGKII